MMREIGVMKDTQLAGPQHPSPERVQSQPKVDFLHAVGGGQRHIAAGLQIPLATAGAAATGKVRDPFRFRRIGLNRLVEMKDPRINDPRVWKLRKDMAHALEKVT